MSLRDNYFFCHSGTARSARPGIQMQWQNLLLDSGFALAGRPGMTAADGGAA